MEPDVRSRREILGAVVRRLAAYAPGLSLFTRGSVAAGFAEAITDAEYAGGRAYRALLRRFSALGASGAYLDEAMAELGTERGGARRARALVIVRPASTTVAAIRNVAGDDYMEVEDATHFQAGALVRVRSADGTVTEQNGVSSVSTGTGLVNGWDELVFVGGLSNSYNPTTESVAVIRRVTIAAGTRMNSTVGVAFDTLQATSTSDRNPVFDGESTTLALADKVWVEATRAGVAGNVEPLTITSFATPIDGILDAYNPGPGVGGADTEEDDDFRYRGVHSATLNNQETAAWLDAMARAANPRVSRARRVAASTAGTMAIAVLADHGGPFTTSELSAIQTFIADRVRSYLGVEVSNLTLTAISVEARITLAPRADLDTVWRAASARLADFVDWRSWEFGGSVDEADLIGVIKQTPGVATLETETFIPASQVAVGTDSLPSFVSLSLMDTATGRTRNADISVGFPNA